MKKILMIIIIIGIGGIVFLVSSNKTPEPIKPPIVDHFACSDYCPGPAENYMVKVYEGIEDEQECVKLGGTPSSYTGWQTYHICLAK